MAEETEAGKLTNKFKEEDKYHKISLIHESLKNVNEFIYKVEIDSQTQKRNLWLWIGGGWIT